MTATVVGRRTPARQRRQTSRVLFLAAAVIALVPVDFVQVTATWRYVTLAALVVGVIAALWELSHADTVVVWPALGFGALILIFNQFMNFNPIGFLTLLAPVVIGAGLAVAVRNPLALLVGLSVLLAVSMGIELAMHQHLFSQFFGAENYTAYSRDIFRARGLIGQAVPAGMIAVGLAAASWLLSASAPKNRTSIRWVIACAAAVSVLTSGTRSAIVCGGALALTIGAAGIYRNHRNRLAIGHRVAWAGPLVLAVGIILTAAYWTTLSTQRVFSFDLLAGSASLENRNYASLVFEDWSEGCSGTCVVFGSGARSLLTALGNGLGFHGFTTVDNVFMSLLWDFGILMLVGLAVLVVLAIRALLTSDSATNRAGAILIVSIVLSGLFYDSLYIRPTLLLFGIGLGLLGITTGKTVKQ